VTDPRAELADLVRAARAHVEHLKDSGADDLAAAQDPRALLASLGAATPPRKRQPANVPVPVPVPVPAPEPPPVPTATAPAPVDPAERRHRLSLIAAEVIACTKCRLHEGRTQTVFARGNPDADIVFIGEGPGFEEDRQGLPFVGPAGQLLDKMIVAMGYHRDDVYVANVTKCRPPNNRKPEADEMAACMPFLQQQLDLVDPKVIVALGGTAVEGLLGTTVGITRLRGTWKLYRGRIPVMPTYHPAYLLRSPDKKREAWADLQAVMRRLGKEPPPAKKPGSGG
jgi:uracil-DNA glycosylase